MPDTKNLLNVLTQAGRLWRTNRMYAQQGGKVGKRYTTFRHISHRDNPNSGRVIKSYSQAIRSVFGNDCTVFANWARINGMRHSKRALAHYDRMMVSIDQRYQRATTDAHVREAMRLEDDLLTLLRLAFYKDTRRINSLSACMCVDVKHVRNTINAVTPKGLRDVSKTAV